MSWMELSSGMDISADIRQSVLRLLASIAIEEMALAHIINAEAEKLQYIAGTLHPGSNPREIYPFQITWRCRLLPEV